MDYIVKNLLGNNHDTKEVKLILIVYVVHNMKGSKIDFGQVSPDLKALTDFSYIIIA